MSGSESQPKKVELMHALKKHNYHEYLYITINEAYKYPNGNQPYHNDIH